RQYILLHRAVVREYGDPEQDDERIHKDALNLAELTWHELANLAEVETAERRRQGDEPSEI
ncbi:hypothetical protein ACTGYX_12220, partial [Streptococcus suis]